MADRSEIVKNYIEAACRFAESHVALEEWRRGDSIPPYKCVEEKYEALAEFECAREAYLALPERDK